jgi:hypothetical protein
VKHALERAPVVAAGTFDHVAGEGEGAAGEADQGHSAGEGALAFAHGIENILQLRQIGHLQLRDFFLIPQRALEARALALGEGESEAHRVRDGEDVGKHDGGVEREALERLERHFGGERRRFGKLEEASGAGSRLVVLRKIAPGLAHQPDRGVRRRLQRQRL